MDSNIVNQNQNGPQTGQVETGPSQNTENNCGREQRHGNGSFNFRAHISQNAQGLPLRLAYEGWRKIWSTTDSRYYYFNCNTQASVWELPIVEDVMDDPLGIKNLSEPSSGPTPSQNAAKRRNSSVESSGTSPLLHPKKGRFHSEHFDLRVDSNVTMDLCAPCLLPCPHPEVELHRYKLTSEARNQLSRALQLREGLEVPLNAYNRALVSHKIGDRGNDPMMPTDCPQEVCEALVKELMNDIPVKIEKPANIVQARKMLFSYTEAVKHTVEKRVTDREDRKMALWHVEDTFKFLRGSHRPVFQDYCDRLSFMKKNCQPLMAAAIRPSIESLCIKWYNTCREVAKKVAEKNEKILKDCNITVPQMPAVPKKRLPCYAVHLITPSPPLPPVEYHEEQDYVRLTYGKDCIRITRLHFLKLETLYKFHARDDHHLKKFLTRTWCMLKRYQTFCGTPEETFAWQASMSSSVFEALHRLFDVSFECFASPLNSFFKQYCSAFPDTDTYFGSRGSILDFKPRSGSLEANPPFCEEMMEAMLCHFEKLLQETTEPLSFIICVPEIRDPLADYLVRLENSSFNRKQVTLSELEHEYRHGLQHTCSNQTEVSLKSQHATMVVFLQNEAGHKKWHPTQEKIDELVQAAKHG